MHFRDRYRVESTRLAGWDYASPAAYFITICTGRRRLYFGTIQPGCPVLSPAGEIVAEEWQRTLQVRPNVTLDA